MAPEDLDMAGDRHNLVRPCIKQWENVNDYEMFGIPSISSL